MKKYSQELNDMIDHNRDYLIDYFGFKTLERAYLFKVNNITLFKGIAFLSIIIFDFN